MIKIKTPIDKVEYILPTHKVMAYVFNEETGKKELKEVTFTGAPQFSPLTLEINDELDVDVWIDNVDKNKIESSTTYKKDLEVVDNKGNKYNIFGCFPTDKCYNIVTIVFDHFIVV